MSKIKIFFSPNAMTLLAFVIGIGTGLLDLPSLLGLAQAVSDITVKIMKFIALPLLFLSVVSSSAHFQNFNQIKRLGIRIFKYTLFTTLVAALVAEGMYLLVSPYLLGGSGLSAGSSSVTGSKGFFATILTMVPDNFVGMFLSNNVIAVVGVAILLAIAVPTIKERDIVFGFFLGLLNAVMKIVRVAVRFIPLSVWAFVSLVTKDYMNNQTESLNAIGGLTLTVIGANLIQGFIFLPLLLKYKGINPWQLFKKVKDALIVAFFTRSSMATLPVTLEKSIDEAKISSDVARLSLPLCTTINMNGCAQFILLSVYFVSAYTGHTLDLWEHVGMIFLSVIAAIGNAGVPMGCFFLASSILASHDVPLQFMGLILPFYTFIDMVETSLNVWSDISITKIIDEET